MTQPGSQLTHRRLAHDQPLFKPPSMTDEECGTLHVRATRVQFSAGTSVCFLSRWSLTPDQRKLIAEGHDIYLEVLGGHPPVMIFCGDRDHMDQPDQPIPIADWSGVTASN